MGSLTGFAKVLIVVAVLAAGGFGIWKYRSRMPAVDCAGLLGRPLRVGVVTWPGYAGGIVGNNGFKPNKNCSFFKDQNLCVEFLMMEDVGVRASAFKKGGPEGVDIVWSTVDFWANELPGLLKDGLKAKAIMQVDWSRGGDAIVADESIHKIEDLQGKKISLALFTPSHWLLEYNLENSRLDEAQQTAIVKSLVGKDASPDARADFVAGKVDAAVVWEPDVTEALAKRKGAHVIVSSKDYTKLIADVMVAREDFIKAHPDVIQAFVDGWIVSGTTEANKHPDNAVSLLMANETVYKDLGETKTRENLPAVRWADLADNTEMFNLDGKDAEPLFDQIYATAGKAWVKRGYITAPVAPGLAKDDTFVRAAYKRYGPVERIQDNFKKADVATVNQDTAQSKPVAVFFDPNKFALSAAAQKVLDDNVAMFSRVASGAYIKVSGNTDNVGDPVKNRALSDRRAQSAVDYLVSKHHLPRNQFIPVGNGPDKPVCPANDSNACKQQNRRTDVGIVHSGSQVL